jgi:hypothetical protein
VDMKDYYQTNKGRLLGIGGILIVVGVVLYFASGQEAVLELPIVGAVLFMPVLFINRARRKKTSPATAIARNPQRLGYLSTLSIFYLF